MPERRPRRSPGIPWTEGLPGDLMGACSPDGARAPGALEQVRLIASDASDAGSSHAGRSTRSTRRCRSTTAHLRRGPRLRRVQPPPRLPRRGAGGARAWVPRRVSRGPRAGRDALPDAAAGGGGVAAYHEDADRWLRAPPPPVPARALREAWRQWETPAGGVIRYGLAHRAAGSRRFSCPGSSAAPASARLSSSSSTAPHRRWLARSPSASRERTARGRAGPSRRAPRLRREPEDDLGERVGRCGSAACSTRTRRRAASTAPDRCRWRSRRCSAAWRIRRRRRAAPRDGRRGPRVEVTGRAGRPARPGCRRGATPGTPCSSRARRSPPAHRA
jgi:hypothetical protein